MTIELDHIIIPARSKWASATFLASILDLPAGPQRDLFVPVKVTIGSPWTQRRHFSGIPGRRSTCFHDRRSHDR